MILSKNNYITTFEVNNQLIGIKTRKQKEGVNLSCTLAIFDKEKEYAHHLMEYIKRKKKTVDQIRIFTNPGSIKEFLKHNEIEILLINESILLDDISHDKIKNICILSEGGSLREAGNYPVIYKFQSAEVIMNELFTYYPLLNKTGKRMNPEHRAKLISVFSLEHESYRQLFSLSLAKEYSKYKQTIYINLNTFKSLAEVVTDNSIKGLSEFIYYLKQEHPNLMQKMNDIITKHEKLSLIQGLSFGPDLYEITPEDMKRWLHEMQTLTDYEVIIFDVDSFYQGSLELFQESTSLYIVSNEKTNENIKFHNFEEQILWAGFDDILNKTEIIKINRESEELINKRPLLEQKQLIELVAGYIDL